MEGFELLGLWWLPPDQSKAVAGTLAFSSQDGLYLSLLGSFKPIHEIQEMKVYPIILGITKDGKLITLSGCVEVHSQYGLAGSFFSNQGFRVQSAYVGVHSADPNEIRFHKIEIQHSCLPQWSRLPLGQTRIIPNEKGRLGKYEFSYTPPDEVVATTTKGTITVTSSFQTNNDQLEALNFRQAVWMRVETQETLPFEDWLYQFIGPLQNLVSLGTCRPNFLRALRGYVYIQSPSQSETHKEELPVQIFFQQHYSKTGASPELHEHDMLFTLQDIKATFSQIVENWLKVAEDLDSVCNLFFGIQRIERLYLEQKFLNTIQAVESYHRRRSNKQDLPDDKHSLRIEAILSSTPQQYQKWLKGKLTYSNELSLRQRLNDLLKNGSLNQVVLPFIRKRPIFVDKVVNTRNFLTHYDSSLKRKAATGEELFWLTQILSFLIQACFLHELGFSSDQSNKLFRRNAEYQYAISRRS